MTTDLEVRLRKMAEDTEHAIEWTVRHPENGHVGTGVLALVEAALREVAALAAHEQRERDAQIADRASRAYAPALRLTGKQIAAAIRAAAPEQEKPK